MKKYTFFVSSILFLLSAFHVHAEEVSTIKIYPSDDALNLLYDEDGLTTWDIARNYENMVFREPATAIDGDNIVVRSDKQASGKYRIYRASLLFDISAMPENANVHSVSLNVFKTNNNNVNSTDVVVTSHARALTTVLQRQDWNLQNYGTEVFTRGSLIEGGYTSYLFNEGGINYINSSTQIIIGVRTEFDFDDVDVGALQTGAAFYSVEAADPNVWPYLEITYTVPDEDEVPLMTQIESPYPPESADWADDIYANGSSVSSCGGTIAACGCALTSMSMLGLSYGVLTDVVGTAVNPGNMNAWLEDNEGYTPDGSVVWGKVIEYLGEEIGDTIQSTFSLTGHNVTDLPVINDFLDDKQPVIAFNERLGHYFVLTEQTDADTYKIRDPLWYGTDSTDETKDVATHVQAYNDEVDKTNLISHHEDLQPLAGMIEVHLGSPAELLIVDESGKRLGFDQSTESIVHEIASGSYDQSEAIFSGNTVPNPHVEKVAMVLNPTSDTYSIDVVGTGDGEYDLTLYFVDAVGGSETVFLNGDITDGETDRYTLLYDDSAQSDIRKKIRKVKRWVRLLPKPFRERVNERLAEIETEIADGGIISLDNPLARFLMHERRYNFRDLFKFVLSWLKQHGENDHDRGHGNEDDRCDEDNAGRNRQCDEGEEE